MSAGRHFRQEFAWCEHAPCKNACIPERAVLRLSDGLGAVNGDRLILVGIEHPRQAKISQLDDRIRLFCLEQNVLGLRHDQTPPDNSIRQSGPRLKDNIAHESHTVP